MIEYFEKKKSGEICRIESCHPCCWIKLTDPSDEEINFIVEKFNLDRSNIQDGLDIYETPRLEDEGDKIYVYLTVPTNSIPQEHISSFLLVYSQNFFITVSKHPLEIFDRLSDQNKKFKEFSSSRRILKLLYLISRAYETSVRHILRETKENKMDINNLDNRDVVKLINNEDKLNYYISPFEAIIQDYHKILKHKDFKFLKKDQEVLQDLIVDMRQTLGLCKHTLKTISNMRNYYSTKLSNDLNKTVTLLTLATIFLSIPTMIGGLYGMNIALPFQDDARIFYFLGILIVGIWIVMFILLRKFKMI